MDIHPRCRKSLNGQMASVSAPITLSILMLLLHCHIGAKTSARLAVFESVATLSGPLDAFGISLQHSYLPRKNEVTM
jgi:hypothetical protein